MTPGWSGDQAVASPNRDVAVKPPRECKSAGAGKKSDKKSANKDVNIFSSNKSSLRYDEQFFSLIPKLQCHNSCSRLLLLTM